MNRYLYQKVLGICPWCGEPILKATTKDGRVIYEHLEKTEDCTFILFEDSYIFGTKVQLTDNDIEKLLRGEAIPVTLESQTGTSFKALVSLCKEPKEYKGKKYPRYKINSYLD